MTQKDSLKQEPDYVKSAIADARMLLSKEVVSDVADETSAARVSIQNPATGKSSGGFAYAVFDEGVKTSLNLGYVKPKSSDPLAVRTGALGGGQRPGIGRIDETGSLAGSDFDLGNENGDARKLISKLVSLDGAELGYNAGSGSLGRSYHDLTTHSLGLMCDVANGGMKGDLSLIAEGSKLPTELAGKSLDEAAYGLDIASDPTWEQMIGSLNLYRGSDAGGSFLGLSGGQPLLSATAPADWSAGTGVKSGPAVPEFASPFGPVLSRSPCYPPPHKKLISIRLPARATGSPWSLRPRIRLQWIIRCCSIPTCPARRRSASEAH